MATTVDREGLHTFLMKYAKNPGRVQGAMALLEPFFQHAERNQYALAPAHEIDPEHAKHAIAAATGQHVGEVIFVSHEHPFIKPEWMSDDAYRASIWHSVFDGFSVERAMNHTHILQLDGYQRNRGFRFKDDEHPRGGGAVKGSAGPGELVHALRSMAECGFLDALEATLNDCSILDCDEAQGHNWLEIKCALFLFLGAVVLDDTTTRGRIEPLIQLLPRAIPVGERWGAPGTWLVLTA